MLKFCQISLTFLPQSQNVIINYELERLYCRVERWDARWRLACSQWGADLQESDGIALAWIVDPKVCLSHRCLNDCVLAGWDSGGYRRPFLLQFGIFVHNTCAGDQI